MLQERRTDIDRLDANALFDVCNVSIVCNLVRKDLGLAERVDEGGATRARCTCVFCEQVHEKNAAKDGETCSEQSNTPRKKRRRTDNHNGELDTLLDLVSSAPGVRHDESWEMKRMDRELVTGSDGRRRQRRRRSAREFVG